MLAAQRLCPVTEGHLVLAIVASAGCPGMGRIKGHLWVGRMDPRGAHLGYNYLQTILLNPLNYSPVGESNSDMRCDWASFQYQGVLPWRLGILPAIMHIACCYWCRLSIDPSGLVQHQVVFVFDNPGY